MIQYRLHVGRLIRNRWALIDRSRREPVTESAAGRVRDLGDLAGDVPAEGGLRFLLYPDCNCGDGTAVLLGLLATLCGDELAFDADSSLMGEKPPCRCPNESYGGLDMIGEMPAVDPVSLRVNVDSVGEDVGFDSSKA